MYNFAELLKLRHYVLLLTVVPLLYSTACQQRKVKCSGEQPGPCQNCQNTGLECVYHAGPRKRRTTRPTRAVDRTSEK
jgi:hypothetical protein